jgi:hypothetical protein
MLWTSTPFLIPIKLADCKGGKSAAARVEALVARQMEAYRGGANVAGSSGASSSKAAPATGFTLQRDTGCDDSINDFAKEWKQDKHRMSGVVGGVLTLKAVWAKMPEGFDTEKMRSPDVDDSGSQERLTGGWLRWGLTRCDEQRGVGFPGIDDGACV